MRPACPHCSAKPLSSDGRIRVVRQGRFWRKSDGRWITKFLCHECRKHFSNATFAEEYRQNKRHKNHLVRKGFVERMSIRGIARTHNLSTTTVLRKLKFLGLQAEGELQQMNSERSPIRRLQFDDLETAEQSRYKPLAVSLAVEEKTRWIAGFEISSMPVKWKLSPKKKEKYGNRADERAEGRRRLFERIQPFCHPELTISSDEQPHYPKDIRKHFPKARHIRYGSRKPLPHGQDELKKGFDPLFSLNHTCAMHRDRMARLARKSWCLTKTRQNLRYHLAIYAVHHNRSLKIN